MIAFTPKRARFGNSGLTFDVQDGILSRKLEPHIMGSLCHKQA